jgi:hypothetical protein
MENNETTTERSEFDTKAFTDALLKQVKAAGCKFRRQPITDSDLIRSPIPKLPITCSEMTDH